MHYVEATHVFLITNQTH